MIPAPIGPAARHLLLVLFMTVAYAPAAAAQGILFVRVSTTTGPVAGATVEVIFQETPLARLVTSDAGTATFGALPGGTFSVRVEALGHRPFFQEGVRVVTSSSTVLEVTLETSPIELEGLTVRSERVQIQRENTEFGSRVDEKAIELLPVTFDARDLVALTPGARADNVWGGANFQANSYRIDGLSVNHPGVGGDLIKPNINWIDRIEVRGLGAGAEYGGFQGGLIDITTKRGSNAFQGTFRTSFENEALNSSNLIDTEIGLEVQGRYDVEGDVAGALVQDRLFFYGSAQHIRQDRRVLNHLRQVDGMFSPSLEEGQESKLFGKLTWIPGPRHEVEASAAYLDTRAENYGATGY
ncbi:MAG: TonB-dependent receptor, partial [Gemmatimonadota bacterium]|nr:TonB-dependent receptor [Gemmatimonadota bacterium]